MNLELLMLVSLITIGCLFVFIPMSSRYRYKKVVKCPETDLPAEILVDAYPSSLAGRRKKPLSIRKCSLWPKRKGCTQTCLR
jgi:hypothetical protein